MDIRTDVTREKEEKKTEKELERPRKYVLPE